jgi:methionyl-tRNA synthetase
MKAAGEATAAYQKEMEQLNFHRALEAVWKLLDAINGYIVGREPWKMFKESGANDALSRIIWNVLEGLRLSWLMASPFMPVLAEEALRRLGCGDHPVSVERLAWGHLPRGAELPEGDALFPRIDFDAWIKESSSNVDEKPAASPEETTDSRISIDEFFRTELRVAQVLEAEKVPKSKKLIKMKIDTGSDHRTIVAGIATKYEPEQLVGRKVVIVANLKPAKLMGIESNGMVLAASIDGEPNLVSVDPDVPVGTQVR